MESAEITLLDLHKKLFSASERQDSLESELQTLTRSVGNNSLLIHNIIIDMRKLEKQISDKQAVLEAKIQRERDRQSSTFMFPETNMP